MIGGECGDHGQGRHDAAQRQHGLDAFAGRHHVVRHTEPDPMSEKMAHCPPRRVDRRLVAAGRVEPGTVRAGDPAVEIGDRGDQCRPGLGRCVGIGAIVAARMKPQGTACVQSRNAASAQIRFGDCARNRLRHGEETACGFGRSARRRRGSCRVVRPRSGRGRLRKVRASSRASRKRSSPRLSAIRSRRSPCSPVAASVHLPAAPLPLSGPLEPDKQAAARRVGDIADQPIAAFAMAVGEIVAAHRLGIARETVGQIGGVRRHGDRLTPPPDPRCGPAGSVPSMHREWRDHSHRSARTGAASTR